MGKAVCMKQPKRDNQNINNDSSNQLKISMITPQTSTIHRLVELSGLLKGLVFLDAMYYYVYGFNFDNGIYVTLFETIYFHSWQLCAWINDIIHDSYLHWNNCYIVL